MATTNAPVPERPSGSGPNIIGATGGSGTRVIARIARRGGMFTGSRVDAQEDARAFGRFYLRWINPYMRHEATPLAPDAQAEMVREFHAALADHCDGLDDGRPWGWKSPRAIFLLPFLHDQLPRLRFLHLVRDGRDMAYSRNKNQLRRHGSTLLEAAEAGWSLPAQKVALWSRANLRAADYGERHLGERYLRIRFEDLCREPACTTRRILDFFELGGDAERIAREEVAPPESVGRWRQQDPEEVAELHRIAGAALERFGYLDGGGRS